MSTAIEESFEKKIQEALLDKVLNAKKSAPGYQSEPADFEVEDTTLPIPEGLYKFSDVYGFLPLSGIDHAVHKYATEDWSPTIAVHIPKMSEFTNYQAQKHELEMCVLGMEMRDKINITGPTGSGKSSMVKYICALSCRPFIRINGRGDLESDSLLGMLTAQGGATKWVDGTITEGVKNGATICVDEWTVIPPEIMMSLQWLMEENGQLYLSDKPGSSSDKLIKPHPEYNLVFTDNTKGLGDDKGGFAATNVQNTATLDRFGTCIHVGYLPPSHELSILKARNPKMNDVLGNKMLKFAALVRRAYDTNDISMTCSPRTLINWSSKAQYLKSVSLALKMSFFEKLPNETERTMVSGFFKTVFGEELI